MNSQDKVRQFHDAMGQPVRISLHFDREEVMLRAKLITEEYLEVMEALGVDVEIVTRMWEPSIHERYVLYDYDGAITSPEHVAKELSDLNYVTYGAGLTFGIDVDKSLDITHTSNMSKLGPDGKPVFRADGKVLKGSNYKPADFSNPDEWTLK